MDKISQPRVAQSNINANDLGNRNKIVIFLGIAFFAIHTLVYIIHFRLNFPNGDDFLITPFAHEYILTGKFPFEQFLSPASAHLAYSLKLITLPNLLFNSFDVVNLYYLQWIIMSLTLLFFFLIVKRTDSKSYWILIPISAFVYCPIFITGHFVFSSLMWLTVPLCIVMVVYLLTRENITHLILLAAISVAIFSSFFNLIGVIAWLPGILCLIRKDSNQKRSYKKWLLPWIFGIIIIGIIIYSQAPSISEQSRLDLFFSPDGLSFVATFLATSFRFGNENIILSQIVGFATLFLSVYLFYYFMKIKKDISKSYPWLVFILVGITSGIIIAIGRMDLEYHLGNESFYKSVSFFSQIGILVLISKILIEIKKNNSNRNNKIKLGFLIGIILLQMIFLIPSYYASWYKGDYYYEQKLSHVNCYSLTHGSECLKSIPTWSGPLDPSLEREDEQMILINFLLENKLSVFGESDFNQQNKKDLEEFENLSKYNTEINYAVGKIEKINDSIVSEQPMIQKNHFIKIEGWILDKNKEQLDSIFLLIDDKPFLKYDDFLVREDIINNVNDISKTNSGWTITFLSGYLNPGCHDISIVGISKQIKMNLEQEIIICK